MGMSILLKIRITATDDAVLGYDNILLGLGQTEKKTFQKGIHHHTILPLRRVPPAPKNNIFLLGDVREISKHFEFKVSVFNSWLEREGHLTTKEIAISDFTQKRCSRSHITQLPHGADPASRLTRARDRSIPVNADFLKRLILPLGHF